VRAFFQVNAIALERAEQQGNLAGKLRAELEGQNKAHGATVTEIRDKINTVKTHLNESLRPSGRPCRYDEYFTTN
jgi:hypothetical protein